MAAKNPEFQAISPFQRIDADIRRRIAGGEWSPGVVLPSRRELAAEYNVAVKTVQRAITPLVEDGTLEANPRRGTVVSSRPHLTPQEALLSNDLSPGPGRTGGQKRSRPSSSLSASSALEFAVAASITSSPALLTVPATLGVVASFFPDRPMTGAQEYWVRSILTALDVAFSQAGGNTRLFNRVQSDQVIVPYLDAVRCALNAGVDALVVVDLNESERSNAYAEVVSAAGRHTPLVLINSRAFDWPISHVFYDQRMAGYQAAQHLIRQGYCQLVFLAPFAADWAEARIVGAQAAVAHASLPAQALYIYPAERTDPIQDEMPYDLRGYGAMQSALREMQILGTGIIAANDGTALGAMRAGQEVGLKAGVDYGLIGFDDNPDATKEGISTMRPPLEAIGEAAARLAVQALRGQITTAQVRLCSHLIARASTAVGRRG